VIVAISHPSVHDRAARDENLPPFDGNS